MDSITQGLLGATIAEAGWREKLGGRAVVWGAFVAVAPDFDIAAGLAGEWASIVHHRGVSHSWLVESAVAPLLGWLAWRTIGKREGSWRSWAHLTWWALITHPALDVCTAYGTQLFAPVTTHRYAIDAISIIDLFYSVPLFVAVLYSRFGKDRRRARKVAIGALVCSTLYLGLGFVQSQRAVARAEADLVARGDFEPVEVRALPSFANILVHKVIARDDRGRFRLSLASSTLQHDLEWTAVEQEDDPLVRRTMDSETGRLLQWFSMGFALFDVQATDHGHVVRVRDLRYGGYADPTQTFMGARFLYDLDGNLIEAERTRPDRDDRDLSAEVAALWRWF